MWTLPRSGSVVEGDRMTVVESGRRLPPVDPVPLARSYDWPELFSGYGFIFAREIVGWVSRGLFDTRRWGFHPRLTRMTDGNLDRLRLSLTRR